VFVDGVDRGQTPARLSVTPGAHILELRGRGVPRVIPFNVAAGAEVSQYLEFANTPETGSLRVESQPPGAKVLVDGTDRGTAPLTVSELLPGDHEVVLQTPLGSARHVVNVQAGGTASLVAPVAAAATAAGPVSGWLTVKAPFSLEIREDGQLLGTTDSERLMLAAGRHDIQLVSETLGYRVTRVVNVTPGKVSMLSVDLPNGVLSVNATPWAEVWIDGHRVGETPIGNLAVSIGPHEVVFRHPQLGEKRHAISVTLSGPTRLSVDMK
jgi:eukaryotic-like serine/threonine-protein kinase